MTGVYERDLYSMKYAILKSPYHKKVVTNCADILGIPPMKMRRLLIENLDMMMLESLGVRYDSWLLHGDKEGGIKKEIGYELFTSFIPVIPKEIMEESIQPMITSENKIEDVKGMIRRLLFREGE